jgi:hypothetical protein
VEEAVAGAGVIVGCGREGDGVVAEGVDAAELRLVRFCKREGVCGEGCSTHATQCPFLPGWRPKPIMKAFVVVRKVKATLRSEGKRRIAGRDAGVKVSRRG